MKIAVIGAGGVDGYFGGRLALEGFDVTFMACGEHLKAMQQNGLRVNIINSDFHIQTVAFIDAFPSISTYSLTRDVWESKPSEIEYQNGTVAKLATKLGVDVPVNRFVYHCILPMEQRARKVHFSR